jgi:hypothetical protein
MKEYLSASALAGYSFLVSFVPYGWAILRDRKKADGMKPTKTSWFIWIAVDCISLAGMWSRDAVNGQIVGTIIGGIIILGLALKYGKPGVTPLEEKILFGAGLAVYFWVVFDTPELGILMSGILIVVGAFPTWMSAIEDPTREDKLAWTIMFVSCIFALVAIPRWDTLADTIQPISFTIIETIMMIILYVPRRK